jgi:hypothetical protein
MFDPGVEVRAWGGAEDWRRFLPQSRGTRDPSEIGRVEQLSKSAIVEPTPFPDCSGNG